MKTEKIVLKKLNSSEIKLKDNNKSKFLNSKNSNKIDADDEDVKNN